MAQFRNSKKDPLLCFSGPTKGRRFFWRGCLLKDYAKPYLRALLAFWPATPFTWPPPPQPPQPPDDTYQPTALPNLFNLTNFKEAADNYLSAAFNAFNQPPTAPEPSGVNHTTPTGGTVGALSRLISTIERISPKIIENIRTKLDSLGQK